MYRGTTPTLKFTLPFEAGTLAGLTQEETLKLGVSDRTEIQLRVRLADGNALASQIFAVSTERILKDGVI